MAANQLLLDQEAAMRNDIPTLGHGYYWQDLAVGQRFMTLRRTVTPADIVNFISVTGMLASIFIAHTCTDNAIPGRPAPAALTYSLAEGLVMQGMLQNTGLAQFEVHQKLMAPVVAGDTIYAIIEVTGIRPTTQLNRAIVNLVVEVRNQRGTPVMSYVSTRLLAGKPT